MGISPIDPSIEACAQDYLDHARAINDLARYALEKAIAVGKSTLDLKVSIGLSLQAGELAGKSMLRSVGIPVEEIRKKHRDHKLPELLCAVDSLFASDANRRFEGLIGLQCQKLSIDGRQYGTTIGAYLDKHFKAGPSAMPRSYFYPDEITFIVPVPPNSLFELVEVLIGAASEAASRSNTRKGFTSKFEAIDEDSI